MPTKSYKPYSIKKRHPVVKKSTCKKLLSKKIGINMKEYKSGRFTSAKQAIAVSYSQVSKLYPHCKRFMSQ